MRYRGLAGAIGALALVGGLSIPAMAATTASPYPTYKLTVTGSWVGSLTSINPGSADIWAGGSAQTLTPPWGKIFAPKGTLSITGTPSSGWQIIPAANGAPDSGGYDSNYCNGNTFNFTIPSSGTWSIGIPQLIGELTATQAEPSGAHNFDCVVNVEPPIRVLSGGYWANRQYSTMMYDLPIMVGNQPQPVTKPSPKPKPSPSPSPTPKPKKTTTHTSTTQVSPSPSPTPSTTHTATPQVSAKQVLKINGLPATVTTGKTLPFTATLAYSNGQPVVGGFVDFATGSGNNLAKAYGYADAQGVIHDSVHIGGTPRRTWIYAMSGKANAMRYVRVVAKPVVKAKVTPKVTPTTVTPSSTPPSTTPAPVHHKVVASQNQPQKSFPWWILLLLALAGITGGYWFGRRRSGSEKE